MAGLVKDGGSLLRVGVVTLRIRSASSLVGMGDKGKRPLDRRALVGDGILQVAVAVDSVLGAFEFRRVALFSQVGASILVAAELDRATFGLLDRAKDLDSDS